MKAGLARLLLAAIAATEPCALCTPAERMAVLARAGGETFDRLAAPGRTLLRAMAVDASGASLPVVTLTRDGARATVEATEAPGRRFSKPIGLDDFRRAEAEAKALKPAADGSACTARSASVQVRSGEGPMSAMDNRGCDATIERVAEAFAALALRAQPACSGAGGRDAFERLRYCLRR